MTLAQLRSQARRWVHNLGLRHWTVHIHILGELENPHADARCECRDDYNIADISFRQDFMDHASEEEIEITVVHELLHVLMRDLDAAAERCKPHMAPMLAMMWADGYSHEAEKMIDGLSKLLVALHNE